MVGAADKGDHQTLRIEVSGRGRVSILRSVFVSRLANTG